MILSRSTRTKRSGSLNSFGPSGDRTASGRTCWHQTRPDPATATHAGRRLARISGPSGPSWTRDAGRHGRTGQRAPFIARPDPAVNAAGVPLPAIAVPSAPAGCLRCRHSERRTGGDVSVAGHQDRPLAAEKATDDLTQPLEGLPPGRPSSPSTDDGTRKPPVPRLADRELPLPDEQAADADLDSPDAEEPSQRSLDTNDLTEEPSASLEPPGRDTAGQELRDGEPSADEVPGRDSQEREARASEPPSPEAATPDSRSWLESLPHLREQWEHHKERWPQEQRPPVDRSTDEPGSWRGDSGRSLNPRDNAHVDAACDGIAKAETGITERVEDTERASVGSLAGKEFCRKEPDRLKDKVAAELATNPDADVYEVVASVHDGVRYTLQYDDAEYANDVYSDIGRMKDHGFGLTRLKNLWDDAEYKGINSQWIDREAGQAFEMQFHTQASFEAKQLTHKAYERIRNPLTTDEESGELRDYQCEVSSKIPIPMGASDIPEYP